MNIEIEAVHEGHADENQSKCDSQPDESAVLDVKSVAVNWQRKLLKGQLADDDGKISDPEAHFGADRQTFRGGVLWRSGVQLVGRELLFASHLSRILGQFEWLTIKSPCTRVRNGSIVEGPSPG